MRACAFLETMSFSKIALNLKKAVKQAEIKALNRALAATNKKVAKDLREDTSLPNKAIKKRTYVQKPKAGKSLGSITILTKFGVALTEFKPIEKLIQGTARVYKGVTVKVGRLGRELVKGGFLAPVRSGKEVVLIRKGKARLPTSTPSSDVLRTSAQARQEEHKSFFAKVFKEFYPIDFDNEFK